jgi:hypothetical protein
MVQKSRMSVLILFEISVAKKDGWFEAKLSSKKEG